MSLYDVFGWYLCIMCDVWWHEELVTDEHVEKEGCPECLHKCERCGDLIDGYGSYEHCG